MASGPNPRTGTVGSSQPDCFMDACLTSCISGAASGFAGTGSCLLLVISNISGNPSPHRCWDLLRRGIANLLMSLIRASVQSRVGYHADHYRRSKAPRRQGRHYRGPTHMGLGDDPPSPRAHDRYRRRDLSRCIALDQLRSRLSRARRGPLSPVPRTHVGGR